MAASGMTRIAIAHGDLVALGPRTEVALVSLVGDGSGLAHGEALWRYLKLRGYFRLSANVCLCEIPHLQALDERGSELMEEALAPWARIRALERELASARFFEGGWLARALRSQLVRWRLTERIDALAALVAIEMGWSVVDESDIAEIQKTIRLRNEYRCLSAELADLLGPEWLGDADRQFLGFVDDYADGDGALAGWIRSRPEGTELAARILDRFYTSERSLASLDHPWVDYRVEHDLAGPLLTTEALPWLSGYSGRIRPLYPDLWI